MTLSELVQLAAGSTVIGTIISVVFTRLTNKEKHDIDLLDRAYKEINRLDSIVKMLKSDLDDEKYMRKKTEKERDFLQKQLDNVLWELEESKHEIERLLEKLKRR